MKLTLLMVADAVLGFPPIAYTIRALFVAGVLVYLAVWFIIACGAWFAEQVRG